MTPDPCSDLGEDMGVAEAVANPASPRLLEATGKAYHNGCYDNKRALAVALDGLRKIALGHPCDLPDQIAKLTIRDIETIQAGGHPEPRVYRY